MSRKNTLQIILFLCTCVGFAMQGAAQNVVRLDPYDIKYEPGVVP